MIYVYNNSGSLSFVIFIIISLKGVKPEVGIGGQVLSGGYGFLARNYGLSVDQLIEVEVVLADGILYL